MGEFAMWLVPAEKMWMSWRLGQASGVGGRAESVASMVTSLYNSVGEMVMSKCR